MMDLRLVDSTEQPRPPSTRRTARGAIRAARVLAAAVLLLAPEFTEAADSRPSGYQFNNVHFHLTNLSFGISRDELAKYGVSSPEVVEKTAALLNKYSERFLFGTDTVAPAGETPYYAVFGMWKPVFDRLSADARDRML